MSEQEKYTPIALESGTFESRVTKKFLQRKTYEKRVPGIIKALIPGTVAEIKVGVGAQVRQGDLLMILEAMKMLNRIKAPHDGQVKSISVAAGEKVTKGKVLIEVE